MIVGAYTLDLYCSYMDKRQHPFNYFPWQYVGETRGECFKMARKGGWILNWKTEKAICPLCSKKKG